MLPNSNIMLPCKDINKIYCDYQISKYPLLRVVFITTSKYLTYSPS